MALIQLGNIVTDIKGSIAGTTFRKSATGLTMFNKVGRNFKNASKAYSRKVEFSQVIREWQLMTQTNRDWWANEASVYPFTDRFGNLKYYTGRQFFIYIAFNCKFLGLPYSTGMLIDSSIAELVIDSITLTNISGSSYINFTDYLNECYAYLYISKVGKGKTSSVVNVSRKLEQYNLANAMVINYTSVLNEHFPNRQVGENYAISLRFYNTSGFIGKPYTQIVTVTA